MALKLKRENTFHNTSRRSVDPMEGNCPQSYPQSKIIASRSQSNHLKVISIGKKQFALITGVFMSFFEFAGVWGFHIENGE
jgi:hypothetical protein